MIRVGIVGMGTMGRTHLDAYAKVGGAQIVARCDLEAKRAAGDLAGTELNLAPGEIKSATDAGIKGVTDYRELIAMPDVDVVDVCVPTPGHAEIAVAALNAGKHVLCEKPLARTSQQGQQIAEAAAKAKGFFMPAMCMRFWPQWMWLKKAVDEKTYGKVLSATFRRVASMPGGWFPKGEMSGGALLDLHIHDTDFIYHLFGNPKAVSSRGYVKESGRIDHVSTQFFYDDVPMVVAEGGWAMTNGFGFRMYYTVNFERATADFDLGRGKDALIRYIDNKAEPIDCGPEFGYEGEIRYFLECIRDNKKPTRVTAEDAVAGLKIIEAEGKSVEMRQMVTL